MMGSKSRKSHAGDAEASPKKKRHSEPVDSTEDVFVKKKKHSKHKEAIQAIEALPEPVVQVKHSKTSAPPEAVSSKKKKHQRSEKAGMDEASDYVIPAAKEPSHPNEMSATVETTSKHTKLTSKKRKSERTDDHEPQNTSITSKKKRKAVEASDRVSVPSESAKPSKPAEATWPQDKPQNKMLSLWPEDDMSTLFSRMLEAVPSQDSLTFTTRQEKLDWNKVAFGNNSGEDCKDMWLHITGRLRKFRLLSEMIADAQDWMHKPWTSFGRKDHGHPDMPRKPLTAYMHFYCATRAKYTKRGISASEIAKKVGEEYNLLTPAEKRKWEIFAEEKRKEYDENIRVFFENHPDVAVNAKNLVKRAAPKKSRTPYQIFSEERASKLETKGLSTQEIRSKLKSKWVALPDKKRLKYINKSVEEHREHRKEVKAYKKLNPTFNPPAHFSTVLTKRELKLLLQDAGRPEKPLPSGYAYFMRDLRASGDLEDVPQENILVSMAARWKQLSPDEREVYKERFLKAKKNYEKEYLAYMSALPEEQREWERLVSQTKKKLGKKDDQKEETGTKEIIFKGEPKKPPRSPYLLFVQSFVKDFGLSVNEARSHWDGLPDYDKKKFVVRHNEVMKKYVGRFQRFLKTLTKEELALYKKKCKNGLDEEAMLNGGLSDDHSEEKSSTEKAGLQAEAASSDSSDDSESDSESGEELEEEVALSSAGSDAEANQNAGDHESEEELSKESSESEDEEPVAPANRSVVINVHKQPGSDDSGSDSD